MVSDGYFNSDIFENLRPPPWVSEILKLKLGLFNKYAVLIDAYTAEIESERDSAEIVQRLCRYSAEKVQRYCNDSSAMIVHREYKDSEKIVQR